MMQVRGRTFPKLPLPMTLSNSNESIVSGVWGLATTGVFEQVHLPERA
jgi:hypothetical protein